MIGSFGRGAPFEASPVDFIGVEDGTIPALRSESSLPEDSEAARSLYGSPQLVSPSREGAPGRDSRRWWLAGLERQSVASSGLTGLAERLLSLETARSAISPLAPGSSSGPDDAEAMAERQRLLQAMASFRGASGVPVSTRHDQTGLAGREMLSAGFEQRRSMVKSSAL